MEKIRVGVGYTYYTYDMSMRPETQNIDGEEARNYDELAVREEDEAGEEDVVEEEIAMPLGPSGSWSCL